MNAKTTSIPAIYRRDAISKATGCLVYLVAAPFVALMLALFVSVPLMVVLESFGISKERSGTPFLVLLPLFLLGVAVWGFLDYRRRANLEVVIERDHVGIGAGKRRTVVPFEDVVSIRLVPTREAHACVLVRRSGRAVRLPTEIAPLGLVHQPLDATLIPELVRRLDDRIARGESVKLEVSVPRILVAIYRACGALPLGMYLLVKPSTSRQGSLVLRHAMAVFRQAWMGLRGGLIIEREGLRRSSDRSSPPTTWDRLSRVHADLLGLVLRSGERQLTLSPLADDYWPAMRWIDARLNRGGLAQGSSA